MSGVFQFTPLREGRPIPLSTASRVRLFQFTPLREGRPRFLRQQEARQPQFQFTPLREGRRTRFLCCAHQFYFNSRPSARGDEAVGGAMANQNISIHAPPRGATRWRNGNVSARRISIHAPPRGATEHPRGVYVLGIGISIHAPPRGATDGTWVVAGNFAISIHAPPRGATSPRQKEVTYGQISIHAPPRGATICAIPHPRRLLFQFTPLREGRPVCRTARHARWGISIHAPPRGATW